LQVYDHPEIYSSTLLKSANVPGKIPGVVAGVVELDPPQHQRWRMLGMKALSTCSLAQLHPYIEQATIDLLAKIEEQGQADFMAELAAPLPLIVMAKWLGLPLEELPLFRKWIDSLILVGGGENQEEVQREVEACFYTVLEQRRQQPRQDLISHLLTIEAEGQSFTRQELLYFATELLAAGTITITPFLGNAILCFHLFPKELALLRRHPDLVRSACEEVLRYMGPARVVEQNVVDCRIAKEEGMLGGQRIRKGDILRPIAVSANHDEEHFDHAECFTIRRFPNPHLAFGHGIHFCPGVQLTRLEARIVLEQMLAHFCDWEIVHPEHLEQLDSEVLFGLKSLPMRFQ
ncbi:MAG: cytochrome P450, partial [Ktedonobacteraceae bacterium]